MIKSVYNIYNIHTHIYIYICGCVCVYVCMYKHIYVAYHIYVAFDNKVPFLLALSVSKLRILSSLIEKISKLKGCYPLQFYESNIIYHTSHNTQTPTMYVINNYKIPWLKWYELMDTLYNL